MMIIDWAKRFAPYAVGAAISVILLVAIGVAPASDIIPGVVGSWTALAVLIAVDTGLSGRKRAKAQ